MLNRLVTGGVQSTVTCTICYLEGHVSDVCPNLQGGNVNAMFPKQGQIKYDLIPIPIMRDRGIILTLGMDLDLTPLALPNH